MPLLQAISNTITKSRRRARLAGAQGGSWDAETHLKLYGPNFNDGMAKFIASQLKPTSLLEFGGGLGYMANHLTRECQLDRSLVIEPQIMDGGLYDQPGGPTQVAVDVFEDEIPASLDGKFDLVLSIEVAEHVDRKWHDALFDFLVARAGHWIVFSAARVGQGGHGHVAERPESEWRNEFLSRGATLQEELTQQIRNASNRRNVNHCRNVMVFTVE